MGAVAFNTYELIKNLEKAGMSETQAEAISTGILRAHEVANLATKADLREVKADVKSSELALRAEIQEVRSEFRESLAQMDAKIDKVEASLDAKIDKVEANLDAKIDKLELRMTIKLGSMMIVAVGVLTAVIKFL